MDVSVIMINYNTFDLTKAAIESIQSNTTGLTYEIILLDNDSPDGSGENLRDLFADAVRYLPMGENAGTSKAFNRGAAIARGKYLLWLNTDILLKGNFIKALKDYMDEHDGCAVCGGNVLDFEGRPHHSFRKNLPSLQTVKRDMRFSAKVWKKLFKKSFDVEYNYTGKPMSVGYITGADMMIRASVLEEIGGFDEDIFMYYEETEFTFRARKKGYDVVSVPSAEIYHLEGASFGEAQLFNERRYRWSMNGHKVYFEKSYSKEVFLQTLNVMQKTYRRAVLLGKLTGKKDVVAAYEQKIKIIQEYYQ